MKANSTISEMVTADYRAANVLDRFGIDFCESGSSTLSEVCKQLNIDEKAIDEALAELQSSSGHHQPVWHFADWDSKFLVEFIVHHHHQYLRSTLPELLLRGEAVLSHVRTKAADWHDILRLAQRLSEDVLQHLLFEERKVFPYILDLEAARTAHIAVVAPEFGRIENPVRQMQQEHLAILQQLQSIRKKIQSCKRSALIPTELSGWLGMLEELDANLHLFIHLETNLLFPRAVAAEAELLDRIGFTTIWFG